jgi:hypothetical protein
MPIENVHRRASRVLSEFSRTEYSERLLQLGIPTLEYKRNRAYMIETNKIFNNIDKIDKEILKIREGAITKGHKYKILKPKTINYTRKKHIQS